MLFRSPECHRLPRDAEPFEAFPSSTADLRHPSTEVAGSPRDPCLLVVADTETVFTWPAPNLRSACPTSVPGGVAHPIPMGTELPLRARVPAYHPVCPPEGGQTFTESLCDSAPSVACIQSGRPWWVLAPPSPLSRGTAARWGPACGRFSQLQGFDPSRSPLHRSVRFQTEGARCSPGLSYGAAFVLRSPR